MDSPLINIITRVSRKNYFKRCYDSIRNQTYKNINHICTYQNDDLKKFLQDFSNIELVRVPDTKRIPNLFYSYNHHPVIDNFIEPDYDFMNIKGHTGEDEYENTSIRVVEQKFESGPFYCFSVPGTSRVTFKHSPYNSYLKIAEKSVKYGWIFYLDDDDFFIDNCFLEKIVEQINKFDEDTLHIFKIELESGISPDEKFWLHMKWGHPFIIHAIGGSNFIFHSKYLEYTAWDEWSGGDYRTAKNLERVVKNKNFIDEVSIYAANNGGNISDLES